MKPKKPIRPTGGNVKQINARKDKNDIRNMNNAKNKNYMPGHHYISSNNDAHNFKNEHYNKNMVYDNKKENHKLIADITESIKHGRNTSAPALKKNKNTNKNVKINKNIKTNYNKIVNIDDYSANKNKSHINDSKDDKKYKNTLSNKNKIDFSNKITKINRRIKNIKDYYNSKPNRKVYNNNIGNTSNNKDISALMKKKLKEESNNNTIANKTVSSNTYTYGNENEEEDDKNIAIDNGENILSTEDNFDDMNNNKETSRDVTPDKNKYSNNYELTYTSENIDNTISKTGNGKKNENKSNNKKKNMNTSGYSYNKKTEHIRKINLPKIGKTRNDRDNNIFNNNYNTINRNYIHTDRDRGKNDKKKSKKMNVINLKTKQNDYSYTKSLNMFNTTNNNYLNKTTIAPNKRNKVLNNSNDKKILNKTRVDASFDAKKNKSVKKTKPKNDFYNNNNNRNILNKLIGKRNSDKTKIQKNKGLNKTLNYTYDKIDMNSKNKKNIPKSKVINKYEHKTTIEIDSYPNPKQEEQRKEESEEEKEEEREEEGCVCQPGEITFGKPKQNQDNYFNFNFKSEGITFVGVCDGHGENGQYVSEFLINHLPTDLQETYLKSKNDNESLDSLPLEAITQIFEESFLKTDNDLNDLCDEMKRRKLEGEHIQDYFNCDYSGSTCVSLLLKQRDMSSVYVANVGDSRTIVIRENPGNFWTSEQLSRDHKPTEKDEYQRIIDMDGEIEAIEDDNGNWTGPLRVWEKGSEGPGLAMTRSLGDKVGSKIGVVCTPEVTKYTIRKEDRLFIIASDGLWEYMPNPEVCSFVKELITTMRSNHNEIDADYIANELFNQSVLRWRQKEQGMDDITIIVVLLK